MWHFFQQVEIQGMKASHIRDAVALIEFADILEKEMKNGIPWDELKAAKKLKQLRKQQKNNRQGFETEVLCILTIIWHLFILRNDFYSQ